MSFIAFNTDGYLHLGVSNQPNRKNKACQQEKEEAAYLVSYIVDFVVLINKQ